MTASFLIGAGYEAYVIMGTASRALTSRDESDLKCPFNLEGEQN